MSLKQLLVIPKSTGKCCLAVAGVSGNKKVVLQVPVHFSNIFLYICIYLLCFYYKIARFKLLASFMGAKVKAVSVKRINYLYRCGIKASSNYNLFHHYPLYPVALRIPQSILQIRKLSEVPPCGHVS